MPNLITRSVFNPGRFNNYLVGGNLCNAFAVGDVGSPNDFFLVGCEPEGESNYPLLSGNILDSEGNQLFRLVGNVLTLNPGHCSKILGDHVGYEIHDGNGKMIFKVKTTFERVENTQFENFLTTISANFYNKKGELIFQAASGGPDEKIETSVNGAFGFSGSGFGLLMGYTKEQLPAVRLALATGGRIHRRLAGLFEGQNINIDGALLDNVHFKNCEISTEFGTFDFAGECRWENCKIHTNGPAFRVGRLLNAVEVPPSN